LSLKLYSSELQTSHRALNSAVEPQAILADYQITLQAPKLHHGAPNYADEPKAKPWSPKLCGGALYQSPGSIKWSAVHEPCLSNYFAAKFLAILKVVEQQTK